MIEYSLFRKGYKFSQAFTLQLDIYIPGKFIFYL